MKCQTELYTIRLRSPSHGVPTKAVWNLNTALKSAPQLPKQNRAIKYLLSRAINYTAVVLYIHPPIAHPRAKPLELHKATGTFQLINQTDLAV